MDGFAGEIHDTTTPTTETGEDRTSGAGASARGIAPTPPDRGPLYQAVTERLIGEISAGRLPWVQPWRSGGRAPGLPHNAATGRPYRGVNVLLLWDAVRRGGYPDQAWLTAVQARNCGGRIRPGEQGTAILYADRFVPDHSAPGRGGPGGAGPGQGAGGGRPAGATGRPGPQPGAIWFHRHYTVYNIAQCSGLPPEITAVPPAVDRRLILPRVAALIAATGITVRIGGVEAWYSPPLDLVQVPPPRAFRAPIDWHRTALHELAHATGHATRLRRDLGGAFGSKAYAREELVAEMGCAFACAALGITPTVRHADYLAGWLDVLGLDARLLVRSAAAAARAADWLLAHAPPAHAPRPDRHPPTTGAGPAERITGTDRARRRGEGEAGGGGVSG